MEGVCYKNGGKYEKLQKKTGRTGWRTFKEATLDNGEEVCGVRQTGGAGGKVSD